MKSLSVLRVVLSLLLASVVSNVAISQSELSKQEFTELLNEIEGTYQVQMINVRYKPALTSDIYTQIKQERSQNETVFITVTDNIRIKVLSVDAIENGEIVTENERVTYIRN